MLLKVTKNPPLKNICMPKFIKCVTAIVGGKDLKDAYYKTETAEVYAQIYLQSLMLGSPVDLSRQEIEEIYELRRAAGK